MQDLKQDTIARAPLFAGLGSDEAARLSEVMEERAFPPGAVLFEEGEPPQGLFLIASGAVRIFRRAKDGAETTLAVETAPATIGELPLFDDGPCPASVSAVEPATAYFICKHDFRDFCRRHPEVALKVLASVGRRLRNLLEMFEGITIESVAQRLARRLLEESRKAGGGPFELPGSLEEFADALHAVREVVLRNLARYQERGLIQMEGRGVRILRPETLERVASGEPL
jgi:CRP/FNR family transcriptional regulator